MNIHCIIFPIAISFYYRKRILIKKHRFYIYQWKYKRKHCENEWLLLLISSSDNSREGTQLTNVLITVIYSFRDFMWIDFIFRLWTSQKILRGYWDTLFCFIFNLLYISKPCLVFCFLNLRNALSILWYSYFHIFFKLFYSKHHDSKLMV